MRKCIISLIIMSLLCILNSNAEAVLTYLLDASEFSGNETVIDFESISDGEVITNQFSSLGVSFYGDLTGDKVFGPPLLGSDTTAGQFEGSLVAAIFDTPMLRVGFDIVTNDPDDTELVAYMFSGGSYTATGSFAFDTSVTPRFIGLEDSMGIDAIAFDARNIVSGVFIIDNFRFESASIPEPSTLLLLGSGLLGLGAVRKKLG